MDQYSSVFSDNPDWEIPLRIRGPTGVVPQDKYYVTNVRPNHQGTTLSYVLRKLKIKLEDPDTWEIEALKHRPPEDRPRKNLCCTVKDVLMHYRKRCSGNFCFFLVRRRIDPPNFIERRRVDCNRTRNWNANVHSHVSGPLNRETVINGNVPIGHGTSHSSIRGNSRSGFESSNNGHHRGRRQQPIDVEVERAINAQWGGMEHLQTEQRQVPSRTGMTSGQLMQHHQQEVAGGSLEGGSSNRHYINVGTLASNLVVQDNCLHPNFLLETLAMGARKVSSHDAIRGNAQPAAGSRTTRGAKANTFLKGHESAKLKGNRTNASSQDKPVQQHYFTGFAIARAAAAVGRDPNSCQLNAGDIAKKLAAVQKLNNMKQNN